MTKARSAESVNVVAWIISLLGFDEGVDWR
jgi:hypothetical protein